MSKIEYSPAESLRAEVERFKETNTYSPLAVTNLYVQAGIVLSDLDAANNRLAALERVAEAGLAFQQALRGAVARLASDQVARELLAETIQALALLDALTEPPCVI